MGDSINLYEAKTHLSELVDRAAAGEEIIIAKAGVPFARLVPLERTRPRRRPGGWESGVWMADDFDGPLPAEILAGFLGNALHPAAETPPNRPTRPAARPKRR